MFQITKQEWQLIPNWDNLPERFSPSSPFAFTKQGIAMLSGILNSDKAIDVNIAIMRAFIALKQYSLTNNELKIVN